MASGSTFEEISKILEVKLVVLNSINREGKSNKDTKNFEDERILRTIFNQKLNEE